MCELSCLFCVVFFSCLFCFVLFAVPCLYQGFSPTNIWIGCITLLAALFPICPEDGVVRVVSRSMPNGSLSNCRPNNWNDLFQSCLSLGSGLMVVVQSTNSPFESLVLLHHPLLGVYYLCDQTVSHLKLCLPDQRLITLGVFQDMCMCVSVCM